MSNINIKTVHSETIEELEEKIIKFLLRDSIIVDEDNNFEDMRNDMEQLFLESLIDWAVEQIIELREKRDEYEKALEFYADYRNYDRRYEGGHESMVDIDGGHRATLALEVEK